MFRERMLRLAEENGFEIGERALSRFEKYCGLLLERNREMNLTAVTDEDEVAERHFIDSLMPLKAGVRDGASLIDIGTGAGFPGLPLKILCPGIRLTLLDSLGKRVDFLREVCEELGFEGVELVNARAEEGSLRQGLRTR